MAMIEVNLSISFGDNTTDMKELTGANVSDSFIKRNIFNLPNYNVSN
jgi:hypothetical protein